ncbi:MAG: DUF58 domain-containing protein [Hyphomicrobiaceae bacterium]|nr:DUF58 domain-containing protein [Hyphomicrobiaceae bacterium]
MAGPAGRKSSASDDGRRVLALEREAVGLVDLMPDLLMEADRIAATVAHGIHGRRRSGPGETFWQFRQYQSGEGAHLIDWRRSAGSDTLFVREREWEAAHTVYLWPNLSPSMRFKSHLSKVSKQQRALVLTLAATEILVRGGERVALLGLTQPSANRRATQKLAHTIVAEGADALEKSLPASDKLARFSSVILISDFLDPIEEVREAIETLGAAGANGHLIQVLDPAEETLPYAGRTEFLSPDGSERWVADRVEGLRERYVDRFLAHRAAIQEIAHRIGWSFLVHHTDRSASEPLLALVAHLSGSGAALRWKGTDVGDPGK